MKFSLVRCLVVVGCMLCAFNAAAQQTYAAMVGRATQNSEGSETIIAARDAGQNGAWVSAFVRDVRCPATSARCAWDSVDIVGVDAKGRRSALRVTASDMAQVRALFSTGPVPVAVVFVPLESQGYRYRMTRAFVIVNGKPVDALATDGVLVDNREGPACSARNLCAQSAVSVTFLESGSNEVPGLVLKHEGTRINNKGNGLENFSASYRFAYDGQSGHYVLAKP